jgi:hypothetical protein
MSDGSATSPETAIHFDDIQLSRVVYHEVTADAPQLWLTFEIDEPQTLRISLGVPFISRLEGFRPAFAVFGPGLPDTEFPIAGPQGAGGLLFNTDEIAEPEVFYEPFSQTTSWIWREEDVELPEAGVYYITGFVPSGEEGKIWIAPGVREEFGLGDILALGDLLPQVRAFHEKPSGGFPCFLFPVAMLLAPLPFLRFLRR